MRVPVAVVDVAAVRPGDDPAAAGVADRPVVGLGRQVVGDVQAAQLGDVVVAGGHGRDPCWSLGVGDSPRSTGREGGRRPGSRGCRPCAIRGATGRRARARRSPGPTPPRRRRRARRLDGQALAQATDALVVHGIDLQALAAQSLAEDAAGRQLAPRARGRTCRRSWPRPGAWWAMSSGLRPASRRSVPPKATLISWKPRQTPNTGLRRSSMAVDQVERPWCPAPGSYGPSASAAPASP